MTDQPRPNLTIPWPTGAPFNTPLAATDIEEVWDTFVKPHQDAGKPQSSEFRCLMAILRAVAKGMDDHNEMMQKTSDDAAQAVEGEALGNRQTAQFPDSDVLLLQAHAANDEYVRSPKGPVRSAILAENFSMLAMAGYMRELLAEVKSGGGW